MKYLLISAAFIFLSCTKSVDELSHNNLAAKIIWTGSVQADGCDWVVQVSDKQYHPDVLSTLFQHDQMNVLISYTVTSDTFHCGFAPMVSGKPIIHITEIKEVK